jgi:hypothetical protein
MTDDQFNELLSYMMLMAVNSTQQLFLQSHPDGLTEKQVAACQEYTLQHAQKMKAILAARNPLHEYAPVFDCQPVGRADT